MKPDFAFNRLAASVLPLQRAGIYIFNVFDIGANNGSWAEGAKMVFPYAEFFLFEANETHRESLQSKSKNVYITALSDSEREVSFFNINGTGDSYYKELTEHYSGTVGKKVLTKTLDSFELPKPDFIKIDTQGSELDILRGAKKYLNHASAVLMEVSLVEFNRGAPGIQECLDFMNKNDFVPFEIIKPHYFDHQFVQIDILFLSRSAHSKIFGAAREILTTTPILTPTQSPADSEIPKITS